MGCLYSLMLSVTVFFLLVILIKLLKHQGIFDDSHKPVFNRLITELVLPVTIFSTLAVSKIYPEQIISAGIMLLSIGVCCSLAYIICRILHFSDKITGSVVMLSGFGSTSTLAYPLIIQTYANNSTAVAYGLMIGEFGVCIPFFTAGVIIAVYFGSRGEEKKPEIVPIIRSFFVSPIFIAFILGLAVSQIPFASGFMSTTFCENLFSYFKNALEILVAISIGLMLRPIKLKGILAVFAIVVLLKLFMQPLFVYSMAYLADISPLSTDILLIEAAMPSGALAAVLADRYGCDGPLASTIVVATFILSLITIPLITVIGL